MTTETNEVFEKSEFTETMTRMIARVFIAFTSHEKKIFVLLIEYWLLQDHSTRRLVVPYYMQTSC